MFAPLTCGKTLISSTTTICSVWIVLLTIIMGLVELKSFALPLDQEGLNETFSRDSEEITNLTTTKPDSLIHSRDWTIVDFLLCLAILFVIIVTVVFCYFLGVFEACKGSSRRTGDDQYDHRTIRGKGLAGCAGCID